jgi:hypothetical protein
MFLAVNGSLFQTGSEVVRLHARWQILTDEINHLDHIGLLEQLKDGEQAGQLVALAEVAQLNERRYRARGNDNERS